MSEKVPVIIRGVLYASQSEAARALGVSTNAVYTALERGNTDGVGLGRNWNRRYPTTLDGVEYSSQADVAAALGMKKAALGDKLRSARKKGLSEITVAGHKIGISATPILEPPHDA